MSLEYLEPGFNAGTLKVAELRRILTENGVDYPLTAKKSRLLELYETSITPLLPELRSKIRNIKPSKKGIVIETGNGRKRDRKTVEREEESSEKSKSDSDGDVSMESGNISMARNISISSSSSDSDADSDANISSDDSLSMHITREPQTPDIKKRKKDTSNIGTPIINKVQKKNRQTQQNPNSSTLPLLSSDSDSSEDENITPSGSKSIGETKSNSNFDFSYQSKTVPPDLSKLRVSSGFAEQLKNAIRANEDVTNVTNSPTSNNGTQILPGKEYDEIKLSSPLDNELNKPAFNLYQTLNDVNSDNDSIEISQGNIKPIRAQTSFDISKDVDNIGISTPPLVTERDIEDADNRTKQIQDIIEHENNSYENENMLSDTIEELPTVNYEKELKDNDNIQIIKNDIDETKLKKDLKKSKKSIPGIIFKLFWKLFLFSLVSIVIVIPIILGLWYREQRIFVGYCGEEVPFQGLSQFYPTIDQVRQIDTFLGKYAPTCIPCPENSICYPYLKLRCKPGYALQKSKYSLFGLVPIGDICIKDDRREQLVKEVVQKSLEFLRTKNADISCGEGNDDIASGITEDDLYRIFSESRATWMDNDEYDKIWEQAIRDLTNEPEIIVRQVSIETKYFNNFSNNYTNKIKQLLEDGTDIPFDSDIDISANEVHWEEGHIQEARGAKKDRYFRSTSKKYIGIRCKFEREINQSYQEYKYPIWFLISFIILVKYIENKLKRYFNRKARVVELTDKTVDKLKRAKNNEISYLSTVQLRDILLADVINLKERNQIWSQVVKKLEANNTNIQSKLVEIHGDIMKCWEWIGPIDQNSAFTLQRDNESTNSQ